MERLRNFLYYLRGDVFKLLPMKESEDGGLDNHINEYIESLIVNVTGAMITFPTLASQKQYLYVVNVLQYLKSHTVDFSQWRKIVLGATRSIDNLCVQYGGGMNDE